MPQKKHPDAPGDIASRLKEALHHRGKTQRALATDSGIRETTVSEILLGRNKPSFESLEAICNTLRAHPSWLMFGLLPKYFEDSPAEPPPAAAIAPLLGVDQWMKEMRGLSDDERAWMRAVPWPQPHAREDDSVYLMALAAYRQAQTRRAASR